MKRLLVIALSSMLFFLACQTEESSVQKENQIEDIELTDELKFSGYFGGLSYFLVANRGSGTVSVFDASSTDFFRDITLPDAQNAQPTYLSHSKRNKTLYVGDFANQKIIYYDDNTFEQKGEIEIQKGAFHMWSNDFINQLWVNNIISKSTSVIDLKTNSVINTLPLPKDEIPELTENAVQHDVTISLSGQNAFVTILDGSISYVVQYNTRNQQYIKHITVGGDAHLLWSGFNLYVPSQLDNNITAFRGSTLTTKEVLDFNSAHGVIGSFRHVFTTGVSDKKIGVIDRFNNTLLSKIDTEFDTPHDIAVNLKGDLLFLSHSGNTATKVSFFAVDRLGNLSKLSDYDSGTNPFGVLSY